VPTTPRRGPRPVAPAMPEGRIEVDAPPELVAAEGGGVALMSALPMLGSAGSIIFVAATSPGPRGFLAAGMFLLASLGFVAASLTRQRSQRQNAVLNKRREYLRHLRGVRTAARDAAHRQRLATTWRFPDPGSLAGLAEERSRVWERNSADAEFLEVRYGLSTQPLAVELAAPATGSSETLDPVSATALHRLLATHATQADLPATLDLSAHPRLSVLGSPEPARALVRAMLCSGAAFHSPDDLRIAVLAPVERQAAWEWLKWLPHAGSPRRSDGAGPRRLVCADLDELASLLPADLAGRPRFARRTESAPLTPLPQVVLVVDGAHLPPTSTLVGEDGVQGMTVVELSRPVPDERGRAEPPALVDAVLPDAVQLVVGEAGADGRIRLEVRQHRTAPTGAVADQLGVAGAEAFARRLAPMFSEGGLAGGSPLTSSAELTSLLGFPDLRELDVATAWQPRPARDLLRVPIGVDPDGAPVHLDIKESAQQGMGPHGLIVGATGSGKSELLRTLVLGMALRHSPSQLNLVLVDFKGGATFAGMADLPHVSALITNLEQELPLVDRMQDALTGEMVRRQEVLRRAGNLSSVAEYERARAAGTDLAPLPNLFVVVDEFSELLAAKPEFIDLFNAMGRLGRSLGLHLLLASQRLEEGRLRGLDSHLSYRVGLRTFSGSESRTVLGVPDAAELPSVPGLAFLRPEPSTLIRFKTAYVSGPPRAVAARAGAGAAAGAHRVLPFTLAPVPTGAAPGDDTPNGDDTAPTAPERLHAMPDEPSVLNLAVDLLRGHGPAAHQVWLPPLEAAIGLEELMPDLAVDPELGLISAGWRSAPPLTVPLGLVDRPLDQRRDTLVADLAGAAGHVAVVGAPRSGKSTLLRTLVAALALRSTPQEVQFFVLDFGGGTFASLAGLPHVSGLGTRADPDVVRRIVAEVSGIIDAREAYFRTQSIDSIETYRARRAAGTADDGWGDVFLVVDGWSTLRAEFEELEQTLHQLAQRALNYGVHVAASAGRWGDFRSAIRDLFGTRLELRLGDPLDSEFDRKMAQNVPADRPGRGLVPGRFHFLSALPRLDGGGTTGLGDGVAALATEIRSAWPGRPGPRLRLLPAQIDATAVRARVDHPGRRILLGIDERALAPVGLDVDVDPHLLVFGDGGSGKSALLRLYVDEVLRTRTAAQAQLVLVDYRRALLGEVPEEYLLHYLPNSAQATPALADLAGYLRGRLPGPEVTPAQLRSRSWWNGAEVFVLVDDYDLVATSTGSPLAPLLELLPQARDLGLHLVLARRSGGAGRALFEPVLQSLRDLAGPALLLSGSPEEGPLVGTTRPRRLVPGRGQLVTRERGVEIVQTAWLPPTS
jgi:S-DNA-T family DNA segregation ATPase FtsK/SpoIIIE